MGEYPEHFVKRLEVLWGEGFMSPGGPEEVLEICRGIDLSGRAVLDVGCGIGGPDLVLARQAGAASVLGVDIDDTLLDRARANAASAGLSDRIAYRRIEPGPLPFPAAHFDAVFSKDAFLHVEDKPALFRDILHILRPGGWLVASDWMAHPDRDNMPAWIEYQARAPYTLLPSTAAQSETWLAAAGFEQVSTRDRNAWYADLATREFGRIQGDLKADLIRVSSPAIYETWATMRRAQTAAVVAGALRPTHLRGRRP